MQTGKELPMKTVHTFADGDHPVTLEQRADGRFRVTYGMQSKDGLEYVVAAHEFGECVFHSLACANKLED